MIQSNEYKLGEHILRLLPKIYPPKENRYSITQLIDAPRIRTLMSERWEDIETDVSDGINTIIGMSVHERGERLASDEDDAEHKFEDVIDGATVVGKADNYNNGVIRDTKTTAIRSIGFEGIIKKYIAQTNLYAWQRRRRGQEVTDLFIDIFFRDFKLSEYERAEHRLDCIRYTISDRLKCLDGYPPLGYLELKLPLWTFEEQEDYVKSQLEYHKMNKYLCTEEDMWASPDCYAIMKKGQKKAVLASVNGEKLTSSKQANAIAVSKGWELGGDYYLDKRPGKRTRCDSYCGCGNVCKFSKKCISKFLGDK